GCQDKKICRWLRSQAEVLPPMRQWLHRMFPGVSYLGPSAAHPPAGLRTPVGCWGNDLRRAKRCLALAHTSRKRIALGHIGCGTWPGYAVRVRVRAQVRAASGSLLATGIR